MLGRGVNRFDGQKVRKLKINCQVHGFLNRI